MPLINGQKMACEPCIRGHRSTKCTHANERLMVPVRKPGRPLSSCPHPSSRPCSCAAVTAAIPRKQKCRCGTSDPAAVVESKPEKDAPSSSSSATTPPSPSKFGSAGFRVQKQGAKAGPSRKQSIDIAGLQRMDASQLNVLPPYSGVNQPQMSTPNGSSTPMSEASLYGSMDMTPSEGSFGTEAGMFPMFPYAMGAPMMPHGPMRVTPIGQNGSSVNGSVKPESETLKSCCGGSNGVKSHRDDASSVPAPSVNANGGREPEAKSCCSSTPSSSGQEKKPVGIMPPPGVPFPPNGILIPPFQHPMAMANGMYPFYAQPNIFNYPPHYGSYLQPLQPEQWRQLMAAMAFQHGGAQAFGMTGPMPMQQPPPTPNGSSWTSHQCTCGDACQCIGCAAHPYNDATQNYVRSAWSSMMEEAQKSHAHTNSNGSHLNGQTNGVNGANGETEESTKTSCNGTTTPIKTNGDGTWSPAAPQTPSDAASGLSEEQALSASDFFFVSYPFGDTCAGETSSCLCGDDCQCIGCTIHNNTDPAPSTDDTAT
ncbi:copper amine oxidase [Metarhizium robertsii]|uniref:Copper amine oxidase n=2 Tax=Metarhizium robertsii TaxID=568076 RepID=A0A0A1V8C6_9HYPO|nr:copper amine oxidase [Metarhizium robertsii]